MTDLSKRLLAIASFVQPGSRIADIGTDHGYLPIYLMEQGIANHGIAMDIRKGPLDRAKEHIREAGLEEKIEARLSNGLEKLKPGEADTVVIAGMGGPLILDILKAGGHVVSDIKEFVLSPQSDWRGFRLEMEKLGLDICREAMVFEDGKYYLIVKAVHRKSTDESGTDKADGGEENFFGGCGEKARNGENRSGSDDLSARFGALLLEEKNPVLKDYLLWQEGILTGILHKLAESRTFEVSRRRTEVEEELRYVLAALKLLQ